jgi:predicted anti-sigma-YlaC factor YlaD
MTRTAGFEARGGRGGPVVISVARLVLAGVAARQAITGTEQLVAAGHAWSELACWQLAAAVGLFTVAARPGSAEALLPLLVVAGTLTAAVSGRDIADGATTAGRESGHLWFEVGLAVTIVVWTLAQGHSTAHPSDSSHFAPKAGRPLDASRPFGGPLGPHRSATPDRLHPAMPAEPRAKPIHREDRP